MEVRTGYEEEEELVTSVTRAKQVSTLQKTVETEEILSLLLFVPPVEEGEVQDKLTGNGTQINPNI